MARAKTGAKTETHVVLLRGVNVGGKNKLPMAELRALCEELGCSGVTTFIQSGNVVVRAPASLAKSLPASLERAILGRFGFRAPVVVRSAAELASVIDANPFAAKGEPERLHVAFLADAPSKSHVAALDPKRSPPDELAVVGRDVYLYLPNGVGKTKLTNAYLDAKLETTSTLRNWRTIASLIELAHGAGAA